MTGLSDAVANLFEELQPPITLSKINEKLTKQESKQRPEGISFGLIDEIAKQLQEAVLTGARGKKLSQLIAESWLPGGEEYREKFLSGDQNVLKQLLIEKGIFDDQADADRFERIEVKTHFEKPPYEGELYMRKIRETEEIKFILIIPYPVPQPEIEIEKLQIWINNKNEQQLLPSNPFITLSTT